MRVLLGSLLFSVALLPQAAGQHFLAVKDGDKTSIVVAARDISPMVLRGDKLEVVQAARFVLGQGGEYLPLFVAVRHQEVRTSAMTANGGNEFNKEFHFFCDLETAYSLKHVFVVIVLHNRGGDSGLFLFEVGDLKPRDPTPFKVRVPMTMQSDSGHYDFYLFSGGREVFQSMMGMGVMDLALDRMVRERIQDVGNSPAKPFVGPAPEYPKALLRKKTDGSATVSFAVDARGAVVDPAVVGASQPEFGEAALAAIRQWRFLPTVKGGRPVESRAQMPFEFSAPGKK